MLSYTVGDGGMCPQISGKIFFRQMSWKIRAFSGKYHVKFRNFVNFLLLARYVPNVAKRSMRSVYKKKYILTTDRPATDRPTHLSWKISNGHISARSRPINFMFGSTMGFSGSADRMALFPVSPNPRWRLGRHLGKFKWRYLRGGSSDLLHVWF